MKPNQVSDTFERGNPYENFIGRWSRQVAPRFLSWLNISQGGRWLDMGCGTGALSAAILDHCAPAWVAGVEPSAGFIRAAQANLAGRVRLFRGNATRIALAGASLDGVVAGLVLNFVQDPHAALDEMVRVIHPGGTIGAYVWDYAGKMELLQIFWETAVELDPTAARFDEGIRFPLCKPGALLELFKSARLKGCEDTAIDIQTPFASFEEYWQPFLGGQGPAPAYAMALDPAERARLRNRLRERLPIQADGTISLVARAWAVRATVAQEKV